MPYTDDQKRQHIAELQKYLHGIALMDEREPAVIPSGVYGQDTTDAVRDFQKNNGLPETGDADSATWNKVVNVYKERYNCYPHPCEAFPSKTYVCGDGTEGLLVYIIQAMLWDLGQSFDNFPKITVCGQFNMETSEAVRVFQKRCGIPCNGKVNCVTWNMLVSVCSHKMQ